MTRDEIAAVCHRAVDAWNAHDATAVAAVYAPAATLHDAGGETAVGRDAIAARTQLYLDAFPDLRIDIATMEIDGDRFAWEWKASGTNTGSLAGAPPTGKSIVIEGCDVGAIGDDRLIQSETDYWNEASMMRQLGMAPEPAAA
jgi:steroid delta-isomerase-like uncharacterized protein